MGSSKSLAVLVAGAALLVSGCTGGGEPEADPTPILPESSEPADPSPSASESEAAEGEAPEMPDAARERSFDGAEAFIEYWAETLTAALNSGDTSSFDALAMSSCESCQGAAEAISTIYDEGGRIESDGWTVQRVAFSGAGDAGEPRVVIRRGRETVVAAAGEDPTTTKADEKSYAFTLGRGGDSWLVREFFVIE